MIDLDKLITAAEKEIERLRAELNAIDKALRCEGWPLAACRQGGARQHAFSKGNYDAERPRSAERRRRVRWSAEFGWRE